MVIIVKTDVRQIDARLLLAFDALMAERSVTRAASRVGLTQQGLSGLLARLRDLFGDPLFVRHSGGIRPTPRAEALHARVRDALDALDRVLERPGFDAAKAQGTFTIAASDYALAAVVAPMFRAFRQAAPALRLAVQALDHGTLADAMAEGRIDLALSVAEFAPAGLATMRLFADCYRCAVRADHPLAHEPVVDIDMLCAWEHLLVAPNRGDFTGPADRALEQAGRRRRIGLVVPHFSAVGALLARSDLVAVLPARLLADLHPTVHAFDPPMRVKGFDLIALWPTRVDADPLHRWFRTLCLETLGGTAPVG